MPFFFDAAILSRMRWLAISRSNWANDSSMLSVRRRSERRLCEEVHLNLAYRWFCRLGLEGSVPDHSTCSKNRHAGRDCVDHIIVLCEAHLRRILRSYTCYYNEIRTH